MIDKNAGFVSLLPGMKTNNEFLKIALRVFFCTLLALILLSAFSCKISEKAKGGKRYVVLSPEIAEIIAVIEGTDNVVGITEECTWPPSYEGKNLVGKFGTLDREKIINLKPDIVFASALEQQSIVTELTKLRFMVVSVYPRSVETMLQGVLTVGKALGKDDRAAVVADSLRSEFNKISQNAPVDSIPKVYVEIYREPLMSVSDNSFVGELVELAGGDNVFYQLDRDYCRIKSEDVIAANPDIILSFSQDTPENISRRLGWQDIPAVRNGRIYTEKDINPDLVMRAGPRSAEGAAQLQELFFYPSK
jgi:ABC-type Fe3+-hydroxamate transport system substrate-binding protein